MFVLYYYFNIRCGILHFLVSTFNSKIDLDLSVFIWFGYEILQFCFSFYALKQLSMRLKTRLQIRKDVPVKPRGFGFWFIVVKNYLCDVNYPFSLLMFCIHSLIFLLLIMKEILLFISYYLWKRPYWPLQNFSCI